MSATPLPTAEETRANAGFAALMGALARPGQILTLPEPGEGAVIAALLDRECRVHVADPLLMPQVLATGAEIAPVEAADHVFAGVLHALEALKGVQVGSDLYPDAGATVVLRATLDSGPALRLSGPGIDGSTEARIGGLPEGFWPFRAARARYPMGFEVFFIDGDRVLGLPRSTHVEVL